jgi:hypothetical protein
VVPNVTNVEDSLKTSINTFTVFLDVITGSIKAGKDSSKHNTLCNSNTLWGERVVVRDCGVGLPNRLNSARLTDIAENFNKNIFLYRTPE